MCVSGQVICKCDWPRDTVRHCTKYVQTGELCPGLSNCLLSNTERRKTEGGVYKCSNPTCEIWDLEMSRGIRERGKYMDLQISLTLGNWMKKEEEAEKASMALMNEANPVESGSEDHASIVVISDDSNDDNEGLEVLQQIGPVSIGELGSHPIPTGPEEAQHIDKNMTASIPKPEVDVPELEVEESTTDDLESLFGGPSCPPTPDMRLVENHHSICLPTGVHLPSPPLSQPTPENPVKGNSTSPTANTKSEQSTSVNLAAQAPPQQQQSRPAPEVSQKPASTYPAQNTMAMGNKMPASYRAVPQHMRPTLSGPNQATLRALRAQTPHGGATPTAPLTPVHAASVRAASQGPRPAMNMSRFEDHRRPDIQQRRPMMPAGGMPIQNGYTASPQVSQRPVPTYPGLNTMAMGVGNNMLNSGGQGMSLAMSAQATGSQGMPSQYLAYQNMPPGFPNFVQSPQTPYHGMPAQGMLPQGMPPNGMPNQGFPPQAGYLSNPVVHQIRTPRTFRRASNGMLAQQGYMNSAYMANTAASSQYAGLSSPMAGTVSARAPAGVAPFPRASTGNMFLHSQPQPQPRIPPQIQPRIPPQLSFHSNIWDQSQEQMASRPQMASGMPGMPPARGTIAGSGPATGQKRSHDAISNSYDPRLTGRPPPTPGGMPITSPANTPSSMDGERQTKRRAM
ncbi:hypothetical protein CSPX01_03153 [Colletotrichum filicis]|nr:hypothetical protein CSPX01_03153 [Colletotrichum filicis]